MKDQHFRIAWDEPPVVLSGGMFERCSFTRVGSRIGRFIFTEGPLVVIPDREIVTVSNCHFGPVAVNWKSRGAAA